MCHVNHEKDANFQYTVKHEQYTAHVIEHAYISVEKPLEFYELKKSRLWVCFRVFLVPLVLKWTSLQVVSEVNWLTIFSFLVPSILHVKHVMSY